jgi:hypothetical protein
MFYLLLEVPLLIIFDLKILPLKELNIYVI